MESAHDAHETTATATSSATDLHPAEATSTIQATDGAGAALDTTGAGLSTAPGHAGTVDGAGPRGPRAGAQPRPRISVIIPTLNEARNIPHVFAELPPGLHEVILVDGGSIDGTTAVARRLRDDVTIIQQAQRGKGDALRCGFEAATGELLVMLDADGSADPSEIPHFVQALLAGSDFAKGSRFREGGGSSDITRLRKVGNWALSATVNILFRTSYSDLCYGYNAFWRHCLPAMDIDCTGFEVETLINIRVARAGLKVTEVASFERQRIHGQSNLNTFRDGARVLRTIARERLRRARRHDVESELERLAASVADAPSLATAREALSAQAPSA
jgi:glycosyltransferase involved in cell wall biosynthesis